MSNQDIPQKLDAMQELLESLQHEHTDADVTYWALGLAWQATRLAYYAACDNEIMVNKNLRLTKGAVWLLEEKIEELMDERDVQTATGQEIGTEWAMIDEADIDEYVESAPESGAWVDRPATENEADL